MKLKILGVAALICAFVAASGRTEAQPQKPKMVRIGVLIPASPTFFMGRFDFFREGMRDLGYVEGKNLAYEYRYAEGKLDRLPALATELVGIKVELIFAGGAEPILAAKRATKSIPILFGTVQDPVASGIVASLAKPGGNATGLSALAPELNAKRLDLLKEIVPGIARVAYFWSPADPGSAASNNSMQSAAKALGLQLQSLEIRDAKGIEAAFETARKGQAQALITAPDPLINARRVRIADFAAENRLPAVYAAPESAEAGGLMSYSPNYADLWRRAATYADRILKGTKPADLPVEQPTKFELIVNLKTAKQIGLTVPPSIARADRVLR